MSSTKRRPKKCSFIAGGDRCERDAASGGLCHSHDAQVRRHPDQDLAPLHAAKERLCEFEGCGRRHNSHGLCSGHKQQLRARDWDWSQLTPLQKYQPRNNKDVSEDDDLRPCVFPDCPKVAWSRGLCPGHYRQWRLRGKALSDGAPDLTNLDPLRIPIGACTLAGCDQPHVAHGLCNGHDAQVRAGRELAALRQTGTRCSFEGCGRDHCSRGLCKTHYSQLLRGTPLRPIAEHPYPQDLSDEELLAWILSDEGQCIILNKGYAPVRNVTCN